MKKMFKNIGYLIANKREVMIAVLWVCFMFFFTYTDLLVALVDSTTSFMSEFHKTQATYISLFINFGIIFMLVFDYVFANKGKQVSPFLYILPFVCIGMCLIIMVHSNIFNSGELQKYIKPIGCRYLSIYTYIVYLIGVFILKLRVILPPLYIVNKEV